MDILRFMAEKVWEWLERMPVEITALGTRGVLILLLCIAFGAIVKNYAQNNNVLNTAPYQAVALILASVIGMSVRLECIQEMESNFQNALSLLAFCGCLILPYITARFIFRRQGIQTIAWKIILIIEAILLITQIIVLCWR
ncbi:MAG: hypothetical protein WC071_13510 [Victivallaceae bacterium]